MLNSSSDFDRIISNITIISKIYIYKKINYIKKNAKYFYYKIK